MTPYISKVISISRFPIITGIVMLHSISIGKSFVSLLFGMVFGSIGVPFFYLISGFLFYIGYQNSVTIYKNKLKKRFRSLLIPYILWNSIAFIIYTFVTYDMQLSQFFESFWFVVGKNGHSPADGPLWFVRTLMILSVISPFMYLINKNKYFKWMSQLLIVAWLFDVPGFQSGTTIGFCWFNFGAWLQINNIERFVQPPSRKVAISVIILYLTMALIEVMMFSYSIVWYHNCVLIMGMLLFFTLPIFKINNVLAKFGGASFFMFCMHEMVIRLLQLNLCLPFENSLNFLILVASTIAICLFAYYLLTFCVPLFLNLLTGAR